MRTGKMLIYDLSYNFDSGSGGTNVTNTWAALVTSFGANLNRLKIYNSSGIQLELGIGPAGSESHLCYVPPDGGEIDVILNIGMRLSIRAKNSGDVANTGDLIIHGYR